MIRNEVFQCESLIVVDRNGFFRDPLKKGVHRNGFLERSLKKGVHRNIFFLKRDPFK